jgi:hypothetical protein
MCRLGGATSSEKPDVQMLWGERRGRGTFGAVQRLPKEPPMSQHCHFDASRSLTALEQDSTIIAVIEMSQSKWLVAALVPGVERHPLKKLDAQEGVLLKLLHRWRNEAGQAGREIKRIVVAYEAAVTASGWRAGCARAMSRLMSFIPRASRCRANIGARRPIASTQNC